MAGAQSPLRRWERFFPVFAAIDSAIEADGHHPRDAFRSVRGRIVGLLRGAEDDAVAEQLCAALDDAMEESLAMLRVAPVAATALASTGLAKAVAALADHESARVRSLARDVVRGWRAAVEADLTRARAAMKVLDNLSDEQEIPHESAGEDQKKRQAPATKMVSVRSNRVDVAAPSSNENAHAVAPSRANTCKMDAAAPRLPTKMPASGNSDGNRVQSEKMMEATKRKLREGYQQVEDVKRQRKIQVIETPKMLEQRQRKVHPILRERSQARCGNSSAVKRSLLPSLQRI